MRRIRLIHWKPAEAQERVETLQRLGYAVEFEAFSPAAARRLKENPPEAVVIDLGRLPSQGRDLGIMLRRQKPTRHVPLVFGGGPPEKVARIQELLPDAVYAEWETMGQALERALAEPAGEPVVPDSAFAAFAGRPLVEKLGIKAGSKVALVEAPEGFESTLGELPDGAELRRGTGDGEDLILWFTRSLADLELGMEGMAARVGPARMWIAWPKKSSAKASDLGQKQVREAGLAVGLVDYKICSFDETWSGLLFTWRKG